MPAGRTASGCSDPDALSRFGSGRDLAVALGRRAIRFGRTAERLQLTPSRVSQTLQQLEAKLGGELFLRTSRRVALSRLGEGLLAEASPSYEALSRAARARA